MAAAARPFELRRFTYAVSGRQEISTETAAVNPVKYPDLLKNQINRLPQVTQKGLRSRDRRHNIDSANLKCRLDGISIVAQLQHPRRSTMVCE
jgi:hypothetical protein